MQHTSGTWRDLDFPLIGAVVALVLFGMTVVFSASFDSLASRPSSLFGQQLLYVGAGSAMLVGFSVADYRTLGRHHWALYGLGLTLLVVVRVAGHSALGARRWIEIGPAEIQPSEFEKLVMIVTLAQFFAARRAVIKKPIIYLQGLLLTAVPTVLVLLQPDLGTAIVFVALFFVLAWTAGIPKRFLAVTGGAAAAAIPAIWPFLHSYQRQRVLVFLDPSHQDPLGGGYNLVQAQIAIGSGGFWGKGFLLGTQGHLGYLPARRTDFIFAVFGEEFGFVGAALLLTLFTWLIWRLVRGAGSARDDFGGLLLMGIAGMFLFQAAVNIGMNLGVVPVVGIPLPFMSFGGSAMITNLMAIGVAQSVLTRRRPMRF